MVDLKPKVIKEVKKGCAYIELVDGKGKLVPEPEIGKRYVELPKVAGG